MVMALFKARDGSGSSRPSSNFIIKSRQAVGRRFSPSTTGPISSAVNP